LYDWNQHYKMSLFGYELLYDWNQHYKMSLFGYELFSLVITLLLLKCRTAIQALFHYLNLCLSVMLDSLSCSFTSMSFLTVLLFIGSLNFFLFGVFEGYFQCWRTSVSRIIHLRLQRKKMKSSLKNCQHEPYAYSQ
jgi:hypothetical protein